jgi:hypothetical protein
MRRRAAGRRHLRSGKPRPERRRRRAGHHAEHAATRRPVRHRPRNPVEFATIHARSPFPVSPDRALGAIETCP